MKTSGIAPAEKREEKRHGRRGGRRCSRKGGQAGLCAEAGILRNAPVAIWRNLSSAVLRGRQGDGSGCVPSSGRKDLHPRLLEVCLQPDFSCQPFPKAEETALPGAMPASGAAHASLRRLTPPAQFRTTPKGHPSSGAPCGVSRGFRRATVVVQFPPLLASASSPSLLQVLILEC